MPSSYTRRKIKALRERGKRMAEARWKLDRKRRYAEMPLLIRELAEIEIQNLPRKQGDPLGCLQWTCFRTGKVTRRVIRIGDRIDRITVDLPSGKKSKYHGWTWLFTEMRKAICQHRI